MAVRFNGNGDIIVDQNVQSVTIKLDIEWNDSKTIGGGQALVSLSFTADNKSVSWTKSNYEELSGGESGSVDRTSINLSSTQSAARTYSVNYKRYIGSLLGGYNLENTNPSGSWGDKVSDRKVVFYDNDGNDTNASVTLTVTAGPTYYSGGGGGTTPPEPPTTTDCPDPTPWESLLPTCGSPPSGLSSADGLQITKTGESQITLNLKNYVNKLVSLKITHQVGGQWTQGFSFNIPTCSDIDPNTGGSPYAKAGYSNSGISGTNTWYVYNIDGGDYNYVFNHSSVPGPPPTRTNYNLVCNVECSTSGDPPEESCVTVCNCIPYTETYPGAWPHCPVGVAISKNGGTIVQWQYEDGGGGNYNDQYVTVEVIGVRDAIATTGPICGSALKNSVWVPDNGDQAANGNCVSDYRDHSDKVRFRIPQLSQSKLSLPDPVCYSAFRGVAGANPPTNFNGNTSGEYSVLHVFNSASNTTTSIVSGNGITVVPQSESDTYNSPFGEANPSANTNLGISARRHYSLTFTDGTIVAADAGNVSIFKGQDLTADGINASISVFKKQQTGPNSLDVWFYTSDQDSEVFTDDLIHVFDDVTNTTNTSTSDLSSSSITVTPQALTDPGNQTSGFDILNTINKKHYLITFTDSTVINADMSNITILINQNKTANGDSYPITIASKVRVDDKNMKVWFTSYNNTNPVGKEYDNTFARDFSIRRSRNRNYSGNVFVRNWYLSVA